MLWQKAQHHIKAPHAMAISGDYPHPVMVNSYSCRNCTDVDRAKRGIDPAHPQNGPYGINQPKTDSTTGTTASQADTAHMAMLHTLGAGSSSAPSGRFVNVTL